MPVPISHIFRPLLLGITELCLALALPGREVTHREHAAEYTSSSQRLMSFMQICQPLRQPIENGLCALPLPACFMQ